MKSQSYTDGNSSRYIGLMGRSRARRKLKLKSLRLLEDKLTLNYLRFAVKDLQRDDKILSRILRIFGFDADWAHSWCIPMIEKCVVIP